MAASLRSKRKISEISDKTTKKSEAEADKPLSYVKDKNCKLHDPDDSHLSKLLCVHEGKIGMLKSELSKKDEIIFALCHFCHRFFAILPVSPSIFSPFLPLWQKW